MSWRPWTETAKRLRFMKGIKRKFPEPLKRWNIVRGDVVSLTDRCTLDLRAVNWYVVHGAILGNEELMFLTIGA